MSIPVLYFHGFASSPSSQKVVELRKILEPEIELVVPDMNVPSFEKLDWPSIVELGVRTGREIKPRAVVGSSMGSLIALSVVAAGIHAPMVMIAPALGVAERWRAKIGDEDPITTFNYARNENALIHRKFFEQLTSLTIDRQPPPVPATMIMGCCDQTVAYDDVQKTWEQWVKSGKTVAGSKLIAIADGDHSLVAYSDLIAREIRAAVGA